MHPCMCVCERQRQQAEASDQQVITFTMSHAVNKAHWTILHGEILGVYSILNIIYHFL